MCTIGDMIPRTITPPRGSYSTDPYNPEARIREFKEMVRGLHRNGIRVIMDVVYNHTFVGDGSNFSLTVPGYFYRHKPAEAIRMPPAVVMRPLRSGRWYAAILWSP